jgi:hypothetical protein
LVLDLASELSGERAPDCRYREQAKAVGYLRARTTGTRTISLIVPSRGLTSKTSTKPSVSAGGSGYVAVIVNVPRAGAPALAVVLPSASARPAVSAIRQFTFASKTLASPLIVTGLVTRLFASGCRTTMYPRADTSAVGEGSVGLAVGLGGPEVRAGAVEKETGDRVAAGSPGFCARYA